MNRISRKLFLAAASFAFAANLANGSELDGKNIKCELSADNTSNRLYQFAGGKVYSYYISEKKQHNADYNFDYQLSEVVKEENFVTVSPTQIFWCNVSNVDGPEPATCRAEDLGRLQVKAIFGGMMAGSWVEVDRKTLEARLGLVMLTNFMQLAKGTCEIISEDDASDFIEIIKAEADSSVKKYQDELDRAKAGTSENKL